MKMRYRDFIMLARDGNWTHKQVTDGKITSIISRHKSGVKVIYREGYCEVPPPDGAVMAGPGMSLDFEVIGKKVYEHDLKTEILYHTLQSGLPLEFMQINYAALRPKQQQ